MTRQEADHQDADQQDADPQDSERQQRHDPEPDKRTAFPNPMLVVVSGPSGVGKSTIVADMARRRPQVVPIVTATTRDRRDGEIDKVHYHFLSVDQFERMRDRGGLLEYARVHDYWYGTPIEQVRGILAAGRDAILTIDPQGARLVRQRVPDALLIFIMPPSIEDLAARLEGRGSEDERSLAVRRRNAEIEMASSGDYDYVIVNETGRPDAAGDRIWEIIQAEARRDPPRQVRV